MALLSTRWVERATIVLKFLQNISSLSGTPRYVASCRCILVSISTHKPTLARYPRLQHHNSSDVSATKWCCWVSSWQIVSLLHRISVSGNFVVMEVFTTTKSLRTPSNLLVINLAFSDFCMMFFMAPPLVFNCYYETWYGWKHTKKYCDVIWGISLISGISGHFSVKFTLS